jgi:iron complex outermembrane receptor protein
LIVGLVVGLSALDADRSWAQTTDVTTLSLEDLLRTQVGGLVTQVDEALMRTPFSVFVVGREDIVRSGADTLADLLRIVPGLCVAQVDATTWEVTSRGSGALVVLLDGHLMASPLFGGLHWDMMTFPLREIERVEVVRGASGASWGVNGMTTAISIVTRSWEGTAGGLLTAGAGSSHQGKTTARYVGRMGQRGVVRVHTGFTRYASGLRVSTFDSPDSARVGLGDVRLQWRNTADAVGLRASFQRAESYHLSSADPAGAGVIREPLSFVDGNAAGSWVRTLSDDSEIVVQGQYRAFHRTTSVSPERWRVIDGDVKWRRSIGSHSVSSGAGYRFGAVGADERIHTVSMFVQDDITLARGVTMTPGATFDRTPFTGIEAQPTLRIMWQPTATQAVWSAASRGVGTVTRRVPFYAAPDDRPDYQYALVTEYEAGYRTQAGPASVDVAAFVTAREDRHPSRVVDTVPDVRGAELAARWQPSALWGVSGSYAALSSGRLQHRFHLRTIGGLPRQVEVTADLFRVSAADGGRTPAYTRLDARVEREFGARIELSAGVRNLLHANALEAPIESSRIAVPVRRSAFVELEWQF